MSHAIVTLRCRFADLEDLSAQLWERGTAGLQEIELDGGAYEIQAYFDEPFDAATLPGFIGWHQAKDVSNETWQAAWEPIAVGTKLWLAPQWSTVETPPGRLRINIRPGQGSGTGYSEPTLLMLEILERELQLGDTFFDVGTGSGILTSAAHALGARKLFACDVDATSTAEAAQSLAADGIPANLWCGSPRAVAALSADHRTFVVANLNAVTLEGLAPELQRIQGRAGRLLVGGFTERNLARMQALFPAATRHLTRGPWQALLA